MAKIALPLSRWQDRDRATWWCEALWRCEGHPYRRRIDADTRMVILEFADLQDAAIFNQVFGAGQS
jgi:hypothetical protein